MPVWKHRSIEEDSPPCEMHRVTGRRITAVIARFGRAPAGSDPADELPGGLSQENAGAGSLRSQLRATSRSTR